jgi:hypothetical protein
LGQWQIDRKENLDFVIVLQVDMAFPGPPEAFVWKKSLIFVSNTATLQFVWGVVLFAVTGR